MISVGNFLISGECMESDPCCHNVTDVRTDKVQQMYGVEIYELLKANDMSDAHFDEYGTDEFKNRFNNDTFDSNCFSCVANSRIVGNYTISDMCYLSYPCRHDITDNRTGVKSCKSGVAIYKMLKDDGHSDEHFNEYAPKDTTLLIRLMVEQL